MTASASTTRSHSAKSCVAERICGSAPASSLAMACDQQRLTQACAESTSGVGQLRRPCSRCVIPQAVWMARACSAFAARTVAPRSRARFRVAGNRSDKSRYYNKIGKHYKVVYVTLLSFTTFRSGRFAAAAFSA